MLIKEIISLFTCLGFGLLSSAGVFTVFVTVGLVPRLAWKTRTSFAISHYETSIIMGSIVGCILSLWPGLSFHLTGRAVQETVFSVIGVFSGMFVGCFAIAIAEMLNTLPIFSRRIKIGKGMGIVILFLSLGKTIGSLLFFFFSYHS